MSAAEPTSVAPPAVHPRIVAVGTANPPDTYSQQDLVRLFECNDPKVRRFFESSHIEKRHLVLPDPGPDGQMPDEDGTQLLRKHFDHALRMAPLAIDRCLRRFGVPAADVRFLTSVTSTGLLCPGLAEHLVRTGDFSRSTHRLDVVGMGCNAGINGLVATAGYAAANPGHPALMVCCEVCSAAYVFDMTVRTGVINSLFGDGAAAALLLADPSLGPQHGPQVLGFESHLIHEIWPEMRFDFDEGRFSFFLGWEIPYAIGEQIERPVGRLLDRFGLTTRDIQHWVVHSGGKKVIDAIRYNLGLSEHDVRHTRSILRHFGNLSSSSFLFSFQELLREGVVRAGDCAVAVTMGPGVSIETALLRW